MIRYFRYRCFAAVLLASAVLLTACSLLSDSSETIQAAPAVHVRSIEEEAISPQLRKMFAVVPFRSSLSHADTLLDYYRTREYRPLWITEHTFPSRAMQIIRFFLEAPAHGLNPAWYHTHELQALLDAVLTDSEASADHSERFARLELLLSDALLLYARHLRYGMFDPRRLDGAYFLPVQRHGLRELLEPLNSMDILAYLRNIQPRERRYRTLQNALADYRILQQSFPWPDIPQPVDDKIEAGDTSSVLPLIAYRLMLTGELHGTLQAPLRGTVQVIDVAARAFALAPSRLLHIGSVVYDSALIRAVMRFQERHGLLVDGIIGSRTVASLNRGVDAYIDQMAVNLERFRWLRYPDRGRYIVVNIPSFWLNAYTDGDVVASMAVCVGEPRSIYYADQYQLYLATGKRRHEPKNHETPQLYGEFSHLILNPIWHVPGSIASRELYFSALKDSTFLRKKRYKVYYRDSVVDASSIKWSEHNPFSMPYKFKQEPGAGNALGAIKFMFPNDHSIYLHDTPQQWAFRRSVRAVSHGCVRIEKPMHFAKYLLEGTAEWDVGRIQRTIWSGVRSKPVFLHQRTPLFIDYCTAWVDPAGQLQFRNDIYRKDAMLARAISYYNRMLAER
ncbi:MAG: L,D-transpeptidase family protein [Bacteroidetes bacterium]|nr:L,D-transpeptidase family protein [Bacteroidota bacterium]